MFPEVFPIVKPILNRNDWRYPKIGAIIYFEYINSLYIETAIIHILKISNWNVVIIGAP